MHIHTTKCQLGQKKAQRKKGNIYTTNQVEIIGFIKNTIFIFFKNDLNK